MNRRPVNKLGLATELRQPNAPLEVNEQTTAWEIYNDRALTIDRELIRDWAALYSAILTTFITESMKLIQEDFSETTRDVLIVITRQLANNTVAAFEPEAYVAPLWAVRVNYYFFTAISCTLVTALAAVLALQWVGSYDAGLNPSSPEGRALQRHVRHQGVEKWRMVQIIAFLPAFIYVALFLFFIGLAEWMWTIHQGVAGIIIAGVIFGFTFFLATTLISMVHVGAPFRTPASRSLPKLAAGLYYSTCIVISKLVLLLKWSELSNLGFISRFLQPPYILKSFEEREKEMVRSITDIRSTALIWLVNSIDVLPHNLAHFQSILQEILLLPHEHLIGLSKQSAPWSAIFTLLLKPERKPSPETGSFPEVSPDSQRLDEGTTQQSSARESALQALTLLGNGMVYHFDVEEDGDQYKNSSMRMKLTTTLGASVQDWKSDNTRTRSTINMMSAALAGVGVLPDNLLVAHLLNVYNLCQHLENFDLDDSYLRMTLQRRAGRTYQYRVSRLDAIIMLDHTSEKPVVAFPEPIMKILLDILAVRFSQGSPSGDTAMERYIHAAKLFFIRGEGDFGIHDAIITQVIGGMLRRIQECGEMLDRFSVASTMLPTILQLLQAKRMSYSTPSRSTPAVIAGVFQVLHHSGPWEWYDDSSALLVARIYALILPPGYAFVGEDWSEWYVHFYTGLDALSQSGAWPSAAKHKLIRERAHNEAEHHQLMPELSKLQIRRLLEIRDPILWFYASIGAGSEWVYPSTAPKLLLAQDEDGPAQKCRLVCNIKKREQSHWSYSELSFTRSLILPESATRSIWSRLSKIETIGGRSLTSSDWLSFLHEPVLASLLRNPWVLYAYGGLDILLRVCTYKWFSAEFRAAGGFELLPEWPLYGQRYRVVALICLSLDFATGEHDIVSWIQVLYDWLVHNKRAGGLQEPEIFANAIARVYSAQERHRTAAPSPLATLDSSSIEAGQGTTHAYVSRWPDTKWEKWRDMMAEIPGGIRRGYIRIEPSAPTSCFIRDPGGVCFS